MYRYYLVSIGDEDVYEGRPADLLEPMLDKARSEVKEYARQEEDVLSYILFPSVALAFLKKQREGR